MIGNLAALQESESGPTLTQSGALGTRPLTGVLLPFQG